MIKYESTYGLWVVRNRWKVLFFSFVFMMIAASGGRYLVFNNDSRIFFSKEDPHLIALEEIENSYLRNDNIYFALESKDGDIFNPEALSAAEDLTKKSWQIPYSIRVNSLTNFQHTRADKDDLVVEDLVSNAANLTASEIAQIKQLALSDPLLVNRFVSSSGRLMGINVTILKPGKSLGEIQEVMSFVDTMVQSFKEDHPGISLYITGALPFDNAFGKVSTDDMTTLVPAMYVVMIFLVSLLLRTVLGALSTLVIIAFSTFTAMGISGWLGIALTPASVSAPTIILTLSVADSIHILSTIYHEMRQGRTKNEAIIESMRLNLQPVFLTSLTTAIGFLSMNASDAPPFRDLGNIVAIGVSVAFFYSVLLLPALIAVLPIRVKRRVKKGLPFVDRLGNIIVKKENFLFWSMLFFILVVIGGIYRIDLNDRFSDYFDDRYPIRSDTDYIVENDLTGIDVMEYSIGAGDSNGISSPEYLSSLEAFASWYRKQPGVVHVSTFSDIMKRLNMSMHGDDRRYYTIPENRSLAAQFLLLYELSLPFGLDLNNQINVDKSATRFVVTLKKMSTRELRELDVRAGEWMKQHLPPALFSYGAGVSILWAHISERNINTMITGTIGALLLISLVLVCAFRSVLYGLLSLLPNFIPAFMAFGLWGYVFEEAGLAVSIVGAMSLGIVVDDTIHFLTKYLRVRRELGCNAQDAIKRSFNTVGTAIVTTTIVLVCGFLVLTLSGFLLNSAMGLLTAIALGFALIADCLFLPPLLIKVDALMKGD